MFNFTLTEKALILVAFLLACIYLSLMMELYEIKEALKIGKQNKKTKKTN